MMLIVKPLTAATRFRFQQVISEPQFPYLCYGHDSSPCPVGWLWGMNLCWYTQSLVLERCPWAENKFSKCQNPIQENFRTRSLSCRKGLSLLCQSENGALFHFASHLRPLHCEPALQGPEWAWPPVLTLETELLASGSRPLTLPLNSLMKPLWRRVQSVLWKCWWHLSWLLVPVNELNFRNSRAFYTNPQPAMGPAFEIASVIGFADYFLLSGDRGPKMYPHGFYWRFCFWFQRQMGCLLIAGILVLMHVNHEWKNIQLVSL